MGPVGILHGIRPPLLSPVDSAPRGRLSGLEESPAGRDACRLRPTTDLRHARDRRTGRGSGGIVRARN